jgi:hypothetical protein
MYYVIQFPRGYLCASFVDGFDVIDGEGREGKVMSVRMSLVVVGGGGGDGVVGGGDGVMVDADANLV